MKNILLTVLTFVSFNILAQVPQGVGYQGVATDSEGIELVNQAISIRASVLSGSANGIIEWEETHSTSTDTFGLFNLTIGQGTTTGNGVQADFADISWGTNTHFLKIEMDVTGGNDFSFMGTNQMMSVPYALYAESANINYDSISNLLSNDSTFITNVGSGMGGGGCDWKFPEGLNGDAITHDLDNGNSYTVPAGKKLYILNYYSVNDRLIIDNIVLSYGGNHGSDHSLANPVIASAGQEITTEALANESSFNGLLVNDITDVQAITHELINGNSYTVPAGKKLYILNYYSVNDRLKIDNIVLSYGGNHGSYHSLANPVIASAGQEITTEANASESNFNGYLVDENYFAGCGGGEGSSIASAGLDSAAVASMIASAISNSVSIGIGDYFHGGVVAYIFGEGDDGYVEGEIHGLVVSNNNLAALEWGCEGIIIGSNGLNVGDGQQNTIDIVNGCSTTGIAAEYCNDLTVNGYNDWFLPSKNELDKILNNISLINLPDYNWTQEYWSSTEFSSNSAYLYSFNYNGFTTWNEKSWNRIVLPTRKF